MVETNDQEMLALDALDMLNELTDRQRDWLFSNFCRACGSKNPRCQCWNDQ